MVNHKYPFPPARSMYWSDPSRTVSYDEAVSMFDAQSDIEKKMNINPIHSTSLV